MLRGIQAIVLLTGRGLGTLHRGLLIGIIRLLRVLSCLLLLAPIR